MSELPEKINQTSTSLIRGTDRLLGRTLAHSLDALVDHLRSCMQMLNQFEQRNELSCAASSDRISRLESRVNVQNAAMETRLQAAERSAADLIAGVGALEQALSSERQRTSQLESRLAAVESQMEAYKSEADAADNMLKRQLSSIETLLSIFSADDNNAIYNFVNQLERLLHVMNSLESRAPTEPATNAAT